MLASAAVYVIFFIIVALSRIAHPYALEWAEGGMLDHVYRILQGQPLYTAPSMAFTPYTYTPFYFYLAAGVSKLIGVSFVPLRLISLFAALGCFYLITVIVRRETGCRKCGFYAAALYAATFPISGAFFDLGRVDSLLLLFLLWGLYLFRIKTSVLSSLAAALIFIIAFWIKQTALVITLPFLAYSLLPSQRRRRWPFVAVYVMLLSAALVFMQWWTESRFFYYIFYLPQLHPPAPMHAYHFIIGYLIKPLPVAVTIAAVYLLWQWDKLRRLQGMFWLMVSVAFVGGSLVAMVPFGAYHNVAMPALALTAVLFGLGCHYLQKTFINQRTAPSMFLQILLLVQFAALIYNPLHLLPTTADRAAGDDLVHRLRDVEGTVFIPSHNYLLPMAGKPACAHLLALEDALRDRETSRGIDLRAELLQTIESATNETIILDGPWFMDEIQEHYTYRGTVFADTSVFWPVTGYRTRPERVYEKNPSVERLNK